MNRLKINIFGNGGWGTALAVLLRNKGYDVTMWGAFREDMDAIKSEGENRKFLPGIKLPKGITYTSSMDGIFKDSDYNLPAIPSRFLRDVLIANKAVLQSIDSPFISVVKGLEQTTLKRMSEVVSDVLPDVRLAVLSGPSIANEVAKGIPTTVTVASKDSELSDKVRDFFRTDRFRVYTNTDLIGVELGGSLKNIIAIAAGISDGLGFGANTKAAILTRGLAEMTRLGIKLGASADTFKGLSGLGDMVTTCVSTIGRNRSFGEDIGIGKNPQELLNSSVMEIEGAWTSKAALDLGNKHKVDLPITQEVYSVIFEQKSPQKAVKELMLREPKAE